MEVTLDPRVREMFSAHEFMMHLHTRALACHCECLGMNAENCITASIGGRTPPYSNQHYFQVMQKWGLINEKGEVII